jgi:hypothetical protein
MNNVDLRAFFYDKDNRPIGGGVGNVGALKNGETKSVDIQAQLSNGPVPRNPETPTPTTPETYDRYEVKIVSILPAPTPPK